MPATPADGVAGPSQHCLPVTGPKKVRPGCTYVQSGGGLPVELLPPRVKLRHGEHGLTLSSTPWSPAVAWVTAAARLAPEGRGFRRTEDLESSPHSPPTYPPPLARSVQDLTLRCPHEIITPCSNWINWVQPYRKDLFQTAMASAMELKHCWTWVDVEGLFSGRD